MRPNQLLTLLLVCLTSLLTAQSSLEEIMQSTRSFEAIVEGGDQYFAAKHPELNKSDLSTGEHRDGEYVKFQRWQRYWKDRLNADGTLGDPTAYFRKKESGTEAAEKTTNPYGDVRWTEVNYNQYITGQIGLGRTTSLAFHPTDVNTFWVGAAIGGVWKTTDGGQSYVPLGDDLPYMAVSSVVVDQKNPEVIYAALSDHVWYGPAGIGIYKSLNGGLGWFATSLRFDFAENVRIYWVEASKDDPNIMLAATSDGLYRTEDGWYTNRRVATGGYNDVKFHAKNKDIVYAGTRTGRVMVSRNAGVSWRVEASLGGSPVLLGVTPLNPNKLLARHGERLHISVDGGDNFTIRRTMEQSNEVFVISPTDENMILSGNFETRRSDNNGERFYRTSDWLGRSGLQEIHVDQRNMFINPLEKNAVYYCNDGGVYRYNINTDFFDNLSSGLAITQYYDIAVAQSDANVIGGGSQDNGNVFRDENGNWRQYASTGDGMNQEIDPTDASYRYWSYQNGGMRRYRNGRNTNIKPGQVDYDGAWETPYKLDPNNPRRLIAGFREVYVSNNRGDSWTDISGRIAGGRLLNELAIAPSNSDYIYTTASASLYVTTDGGDSWNNRVLPAGAISDIEVDPRDPNRIYVSVPGYRTHAKVFVSNDGGLNWTNLSVGIPNVSVGALELFYDVPGGIFIGTEDGVYYRDEQSPVWQQYGHLPNTRVEDIEIQYAAGLIRVGTHGRGVLESSIDIAYCADGDPDRDGDGVCDELDTCPDLDNSLLGTACDDGDELSVGETYQSDCSCGGGRANQTYCAAAGADGTGGDYINSVSMNGVEQTSGQTAYSDFRNTVIPAEVGATYTLTVTLAATFAPDRVHAWIDWNRDGEFAESERVAVARQSGNTFSAEVTVPAKTAEGVTTMRVRSVYDVDFTEPCGDRFGEVEDYTIAITCPGGPGNCQLPLSWMGFEARAVAKQEALLSWTTAGEELVGRFVVERSFDGVSFTNIGQVAAQNTATATYDFADVAVPQSAAYYRIASLDLDGTRSVTEVRRVQWEAGILTPVIFPNPVNTGSVTVRWQRPEATPTQYYLYNIYGQEVRRGKVGAVAGANEVEVAVDDLPAGVYLIRLRTRDWDWSGEVVVK